MIIHDFDEGRGKGQSLFLNVCRGNINTGGGNFIFGKTLPPKTLEQ